MTTQEEPGGGGSGEQGLRVFVSYAGRDRPWALWAATQLQAAGHQVELDVWHWPPGADFVDRMNAALKAAERVVAVFTPAYFDPASWASPELSAVFAQSRRRPELLVPVVVEPVDLTEQQPLFATRVHVDLVGRDEAAARAGLRRGRGP